jgi:hypothetical protein
MRRIVATTKDTVTTMSILPWATNSPTMSNRARATTRFVAHLLLHLCGLPRMFSGRRLRIHPLYLPARPARCLLLAAEQKVQGYGGGEQSQAWRYPMHQRDSRRHGFVGAQQTARNNSSGKKEDGDHNGGDCNGAKRSHLMDLVNSRDQKDTRRQPDQFVDVEDERTVRLSRTAQPEPGKKNEEEKQSRADGSQQGSVHFNPVNCPGCRSPSRRISTPLSEPRASPMARAICSVLP